MSRVILIAGVLGGIGAATAQLFHRSGWYVIGVDIQEVPEETPDIDLFIGGDVSDVAD